MRCGPVGLLGTGGGVIGAREGMKVLRVLHVHTRMIWGGADENTLFTVNGLDPERFQVTLAVGSGSEPTMLGRIEPHVEVREIAELVRDISPRHDAAAFLQLRRLMRERRYHIVHTHTAKGGILGRFAARSAGVPVIIHTLHGSTFHQALDPLHYRLYWVLEKLAGSFTNRIISVGEDLKDRYVRAGISSAGRYEVIRSGMDLRRFRNAARMSAAKRVEVRRSLGVPAEAPLVGKVARLEPRKGYRYFIEMAEQVLQHVPGAHFVGIGAGKQLESLAAETARRGLSDRVHFPGLRPDIADVLASLDVLVLTSLWEGLPRVLVEAAACGIPAVTFEVEGAREIVKDGVNGYIVPSKDVGQLAARVISLLVNPERARGMGVAGSEFVHQDWSVESMVREITAVYDRLSSVHNSSTAPGRGPAAAARLS
jgi:glycosyltransferase involved in cell wall biosynthesis